MDGAMKTDKRPASPVASPSSLGSDGAAVAGRFAAQLASAADCELLLDKCVAGQQRVWLDEFVAAGGVVSASAYVRRKTTVPGTRVAVLAALACHPRLLSDAAMGAVLWPLRLDGESIELRQLSLDCLASVVSDSPRERALAWLRHVQRLTRDASLLGRVAQLLAADEDAGTPLSACAVLLAWLEQGDAAQQAAAKRELVLQGVQELCRRRVREDVLGPSMRLLLGKIRGSETTAIMCSGRDGALQVGATETVAQLEERLGGRLLFAGCVPQSGVFCRPDMPLSALAGCGTLRCEIWPVPWTLRVEGPSSVEAACRIDSRMTGEKALAFVAAFHLDDWSTHLLKVKGGRWIDAKQKLASLCSDGDTLELKVPPASVAVELPGAQEAKVVPLALALTVGEMIEGLGKNDCGLWMRMKGNNHPPGGSRQWLEPDSTLGECGVDGCHVLRCEPRPRRVVFECEGHEHAMEAMEQDNADVVLKRALQTAKKSGEWRLFRNGRSYVLFGWATLAQQGVPATEVLSLRVPDAPAVYLSAAEPPFVNDDPHLESDLFWEKQDQQLALLEAASLNSLVALMTSASTGSSVQLIQMILLTHHSFTTSPQLLRLLIQRGHHADRQHDVLIRVLKVLKQWFDVDHFLPDDIVDNIATYLARDIAPLDLKAPLQAIRNALLRWARGDTRLYNIREPPPPPLLPPPGAKQSFRVRDYEPLELARQITLPLFKVYSLIEARELFSQPWNNRKTQHKCPHVMEMVAAYNELANKVATSVVLATSARRRAKTMGHWLDTCAALQQLQNFHALSAVVSGLGNASVIRLRHTKEALSKRHARLLAEMSELCSMTGSFKNLRETVLRGDPPKIPYLGVYLSDLTFIEDGNPNTVTKKRPDSGESVELIFMAKRQLFHKMVSIIQTWQLVPYNLQPVESLQTFLAQLTVIDDKQMYAESLLREPREEK